MGSSWRVALAVATAAVLWIPATGALGRRQADAAQTPRVNFTHWVVHARAGGASVSQSVPPGGTFRICSSAKLTELDAHYRASLPSGSKVREVWKVTGEPTTSEPARAFRRGYFYVANPHGLPLGTWRVRIVRHGKVLGSSSVTVKRQHC